MLDFLKRREPDPPPAIGNRQAAIAREFQLRERVRELKRQCEDVAAEKRNYITRNGLPGQWTGKFLNFAKIDADWIALCAKQTRLISAASQAQAEWSEARKVLYGGNL